VLAAAADALRNDAEAARRNLQSAFDRLHESREYFYPVEAHLLDLTLVAPTTLGGSLRDQLSGGLPSNLLISGEVVEEMARREPATLAALKSALERNTAAIIGGELTEGDLPLLPPEAICRRIEQGLAVYQEHLGVRPTIFGRRRFGLTPVLPQVLGLLGFVGAVHCTLDDGRFPTGNQSRIQWEGLDGTTIESLARVPIDISRADAFFRLPEKLGNTMDLDHVATVVLAHWPGQTSPGYEDLRRIAAYTSVVGKFATITEYFQQTSYSGQRARHEPDQYHSPYLQQAVAAGQGDPLSRWVRYHRRRAAIEAAESLDTMAAAGGLAADASSEGLFDAVDDSLSAAAETTAALDARIEAKLAGSLDRFCASLLGRDRPGEKGHLIANPCSFSRRLCLEMPDPAGPPDAAGALQAPARSAARRAKVVDLPAMGFAWLGPDAAGGSASESEHGKGGRLKKKQMKEEPLLVEKNTLTNEFFTVAVDPQSGAIRSIFAFNSRRPRLAQQIAMRLPDGRNADPGHDSHYSTMVADEVAVTSPGPVLGEIVCRGRLLDRQSRRIAGFRQATRVWRGSRVIELDIELDIDHLPGPSPWNSYYAARFAWSDSAAELTRDVNLATHATDVDRLEAPHFIDVRSDRLRTTLLTGGLPFHRRCGTRRLDTLLVVQGETSRRFRLGIGIDLPSPMAAAIGLLAPQTVQPGSCPPPAPSGWLFHLDARNVLATHWEPLLADGRMEGYRVRLLETEGRRVQLGLRSFRAVKSAVKVPTGDNAPVELAVEGDRVTVEVGPHAWIEVEARFAP